MCAKIIRLLIRPAAFALICTSTGVLANGSDEGAPQPAPRNCGPEFSTAQAETRAKTATDAFWLNIGVPLEYAVGGKNWMAAHRTRDQRTLLASVDDNHELHIFDIKSDQILASGAPTTPMTFTTTRGEWVDQSDGGAVVVLGHKNVGAVNWYGVDPIKFADGYSTGIDAPATPLAIVYDEDGPYALVSVANKIIRVRVQPGSPALRTHSDLDTLAPVLKAAYFSASRNRHVVAVISDRQVEVFKPEGGPPLYVAALRDGAHATTTWFEDTNGTPVLVVIDANYVQLHFPLNTEREPQMLELAGRANGRVQALRTRLGATFIKAPGSEGVEIFRFEHNVLKLFTHLPTAVANHEKGMFLGPNGRVYIVWTEDVAGEAPWAVVSKVAREMSHPVYQYRLKRDEQLHHVQALDVGIDQQRLLLKTSARLLSFPVSTKALEQSR